MAETLPALVCPLSSLQTMDSSNMMVVMSQIACLLTYLGENDDGLSLYSTNILAGFSSYILFVFACFLCRNIDKVMASMLCFL